MFVLFLKINVGRISYDLLTIYKINIMESSFISFFMPSLIQKKKHNLNLGTSFLLFFLLFFCIKGLGLLKPLLREVEKNIFEKRDRKNSQKIEIK